LDFHKISSNLIRFLVSNEAKNYIWSDTYFLEKRKISYVGSSRFRNVVVARPKPVKESIIDRILFLSNTASLLVCLCYIVNGSKGYPLAL